MKAQHKVISPRQRCQERLLLGSHDSTVKKKKGVNYVKSTLCGGKYVFENIAERRAKVYLNPWYKSLEQGTMAGEDREELV